MVQAGWFTQRRWNGTWAVEVPLNASAHLELNASGACEVVLPLPDTFRAEEPGEHVFSVEYSWSNGRDSADGAANCTVLVFGLDGDGEYALNATLLWLPVSTDRGLAVLLYRWPDTGGYVTGRDWLHGSLGDRYLSPCLWGVVSGNASRFNLTALLGGEPPSDASCSCAELGVHGLAPSGLEGSVECRGYSGQHSLAELNVTVRELAVAVDELHWLSGPVEGRLRVLDWAAVETLPQGYVVLVLEDLSSGAVTETWVASGQPFRLQPPREYALWAVAVAPSVDTVYVNTKYGRQLLVRQPPVP